MFKLPSFSEWISSKSILWQANFGYTMKVLPFFLIIYGYAICRTMFGISQELAFGIPMLLGILMFGAYLSWDFGNRNASTAYLPLNMTLVWDASRIDEIVTTITDFIPLKEDKETNTYNYMMKFDLPQKDDKDQPYQHAIFLSHHPIDKAFRRIPGQLVAHRGSVFEGFAARIVATYCNEFEDVISTMPEEMMMGHFKIFHTKWCLEDSQKDQEALGLFGKNGVDEEGVKDAAQLEVDRKATRIAMQLRETQKQLDSFSEAYQTSDERAKKIVNRLLDNEEKIKEDKSLTTRIVQDKRLRLILGLIAAGLGLYLLRYYQVI